MQFEHIFTPIKIGPITVSNRIVRTPCGDPGSRNKSYAERTESRLAYYEARARGGVGLIFFHAFNNAAVVRAAGGSPDLDFADGGYYRRLVERLQAHGAKGFVQLVHQGRDVSGPDGGAGWGPTDLPGYNMAPLSLPLESVPVAMTRAQIRDTVAAYADATKVARDAGVPGVEVRSIYALPHHFLSPVWNRRTDEYGGSPERRMRFIIEVLSAVREAAGPAMAVGVRVSAADMFAGGMTIEDTQAVARELESLELIDYLNVGLGDIGRFVHRIAAPMSEPHGYELPVTVPVAQSVSLPAIVTGRILTLEEAEEIVASGKAQLVAMTRATLADPDLVKKTREGRAREVRPCIGCNEACVGERGIGAFGCAVNISAANESRLSEDLIAVVSHPKLVLVVGGGPGGLEAARVAALRGHRVTLCEATDRLGGQVDLARRAPLRSEIGLIVDWLISEIRRLGVEVQTGVRVDSGLVEKMRPDGVIVATGSTPRLDGFQIARPAEPIQGATLPNVYSSWDVLSGTAQVGRSAVVFDDIGHYEAIGLAEHLVSNGTRVDFVCRFPAPGPRLEAAQTASPARARLGRAGMVTHALSQLVSVDSSTAVVRHLETDVETRIAIDSAVLVLAPLANRSLVDDLAQYRGEVRDVGDARGPMRTPGFLMRAIHEGHMAGRELLTRSEAAQGSATTR